MSRKIDTVIVGGGQAGLSTSYYLKQGGHEHVVLEQAAQAGNAWRNDRWDSFTFVSPNWFFRLPGAEYKGNEPHGYMLRDEIVSRFEQYEADCGLPVQHGARVASVEAVDGGYVVRTADDELHARQVVIATGLYQRHKLPTFSSSLDSSIMQMHSGQYRNPDALSPGAVLVAGSGQTGCQIAQELYQHGRTVYLSTGGCGRVPRRYRGRDIFAWLEVIGFMDQTPDTLPSSKARFNANPHVSGRDGGQNLNLHQFCADGVILLGHIQDGAGHRIGFAGDLKENLAKSDKSEADMLKRIDDVIARDGIQAPPEEVPVFKQGYAAKDITDLDLRAAGISTIIWTMGYSFDFSLVKLPILDGDGYPVQTRGATRYPGLYFVGLPWLTRRRSGLVGGVALDAQAVAEAIIKKA